MFRMLEPAAVYARAEQTSAVVASLVTGHVIVVLCASETWVQIHARAGTDDVSGFVPRAMTNFGEAK